MKKVFPPGTILQRLYIFKRISKLKLKQVEFLELGGGNGALSNLLLSHGFTGMSFDLNKDSCLINESNNSSFIIQKKFKVINDNLIEYDFKNQHFDLIISSMVIEHLDNETVAKYFKKCKSLLNPDGIIITLVPASMNYWGIEDEIAGHFRRYSFNDFEKIAKEFSLKINDIAGLTFPLSNILFPLSNYLVRRQESKKLSMTKQEQTVLSGNRNVRMKTTFPTIFGFILNNVTMYPFNLLQMAFRKSDKAMIIYCELQDPLPKSGDILPIGGTVLPIGGTILPIGRTILPIGGTILPIGGTVLPIGRIISLIGNKWLFSSI